MNKQGCSVDTNVIRARTISFDRHGSPRSSRAKRAAGKCDYLFLAADSGRSGIMWVVPLELKSTGLRPATVVRQLQGGARVAEDIVAGVSPVEFMPVAVHGRKLHRQAVQELRKQRVRFRKGRYRIVTLSAAIVWRSYRGRLTAAWRWPPSDGRQHRRCRGMVSRSGCGREGRAVAGAVRIGAAAELRELG